MLAKLTVLPSSTATTYVAEAGLVVPATVASITASLARAALSAKALATAARRLSAVPIPWGSGVRSTSSAALARGERAGLGVVGVRHPVEDHEHRPAPGSSDASRAIASSLRECLIALVAHAGHPRRGLLAVVVALAERLDPARLAVAVRPDRAAAAQARPRLRGRHLHGSGQLDRGADRTPAQVVQRALLPRRVRGRGRPVGPTRGVQRLAARLAEAGPGLHGLAAVGTRAACVRPGLGRRGRHTSVQLRTALASLTSSTRVFRSAASRASAR